MALTVENFLYRHLQMFGGGRVDADILCACSVVAFIVLLSIVARSVAPSTHSGTEAAPQKGRELLTQSMEWLRLSEQDTVPLFAYSHTAYALAYLNAARLVAPDRELQRHGTDIHKLSTKLAQRLVELSKKITTQCAGANPKGKRNSGINWI